MAADDFFSRWSKSKPATAAQAEQATVAPSNEKPSRTADIEEPAPSPTLDDVAKLTHESDFSRFVGRDVDETVKRSALKKLFSNPHFNVMDGLDIYIDDYNKFTPLAPAMLASLEHAKSLLNPPEMKKRDRPAANGRPDAQESASQEASGDVAGNESALPDDDRQSGSNDVETAAPAAEQSLSMGSADETASDIEVEDKPLSQGGS